MGARGPRPTPTETLRVRGSWRAGKRKNEPQPPSDIPAAPEWLSGPARLIYERMRKSAGIATVCTAADADTLAHLADCYDTMNRCKDAEGIWKAYVGPNGAACINPLQKHWLEVSALAMKLERELGLSPTARVGMTTGGIDRKVDSCFAF